MLLLLLNILAMVCGTSDISSPLYKGGSWVQSCMDVNCVYQLFAIILAYIVLFSSGVRIAQLYFWVKFCVVGAGGSGRNGHAGRGGWALPSTEHAQHSGRVIPDARGGAGSSGSELPGRMTSDVRDRNSYSRGKGRN